MSKPDLFPKTSTAGIAVDPRTLERVIPESRRPDGSVRKEKKIRPGFTPQEDISRFRGKKQAQMDANTLPKGHIIGWVPPTTTSNSAAAVKSKSAKKNEKRKEKRKEKAVEVKVKDDWEDDDEDEEGPPSSKSEEKPKVATPKPEGTTGETASDSNLASVTDKLDKLNVQS